MGAGSLSVPRPANLVETPPTIPAGHKLLRFGHVDVPKLTHSLIRYPAKFHPPVAHALVTSFSDPGQLILDPFCGSGTLLVTSMAAGRNAIGSDIDPIAVTASKAKTHRWRPGHLASSWRLIDERLRQHRRTDDEYTERQFVDLSTCEYENSIRDQHLWVPAIPNLFHWFRRYVIVDLARISRIIEESNIPATHRLFFRLMLASIVRRSSNADPVPVSGLEVTSHMRRLEEKGRKIDPFSHFSNCVHAGLKAAREFYETVPKMASSTVLSADARFLTSRVRRRNQIDRIITSPPYQNAVDYYRRHQLEMYWLGLSRSHGDRLQLLQNYIGRPQVRKDSVPPKAVSRLGELGRTWHDAMCLEAPERARAFLHYMASTRLAFEQLEQLLRNGGYLVLVVGNSQWNGETVPTGQLMMEVMPRNLQLTDRYWYPLRNRHMSYGRRNGANIGEEFVLLFQKNQANS